MTGFTFYPGTHRPGCLTFAQVPLLILAAA